MVYWVEVGGMEWDVGNLGWRPWDLLAGGFLTAGLAFGVYKFGRSNELDHDKDHPSHMARHRNNNATVRGDILSDVPNVREVDAKRLRECMAYALTGGSEMTISVPQPDQETKRLADSLRRSQMAEQERRFGAQDRGDTGTRNARFSPTHRAPVRANAERQSPTRRRGRAGQLTSAPMPSTSSGGTTPPAIPSAPQPQQRATPELVTSPTEHTKQLQAYRQRLDNWVRESEIKINELEQQRLGLSTELQRTHEALTRSRQDQEAEERKRQEADARLNELEEKLQQRTVLEHKLATAEEQVRQLERQCAEMDEQWEKLFQDNIITPRDAARDNVHEHQELRQLVEQMQNSLQERDRDVEEMDNEIRNLSLELQKARRDQRGLAEENARFQKEAHAVRDMLHKLSDLLRARWGHLLDDRGQGHQTSSLAKAKNAGEDVPLEKMLTEVVSAVEKVLAHLSRRSLT